MRVRMRRFTESGTDPLGPDFLPSRAGDGSTLCTTPTGFTHFVCTAAPRSEAFGHPCSSHELLSILILSMFSPSQPTLATGTMASADPCRLNLASLPGLLDSRTAGLPRQEHWLSLHPRRVYCFGAWLHWASLSFANSPGRTASYPLRVPRAAGLPPASSRPHLAVTPLPSA